MSVEIKIITFEDIFQHEAKDKGIFTDDYQKLGAQIILDKQDMAKIGVKEGQNVKIENDMGTIVVTAKPSDDDVPHPEIAFMVKSAWTSQLMKEDDCQTSRPDHVTAKISLTDEQPTKLSVLLERIQI